MTECFDLRKSMGAFCTCCRNTCLRVWRCVFPAVICVVLVVALSGCGCGRKKAVESGGSAPAGVAEPVSRVSDKSYRAALEKHRDDQKVVARERNQLGDEMREKAERVKAGLAAEVSEEDFKAALEQDEEWQKLKERQAVLDQDVQNVLREARETVRERIMREERDAKASGG